MATGETEREREETLNKNIKPIGVQYYINFRERKNADGRYGDPVCYTVLERTYYYNSSRGRPKPLPIQNHIVLYIAYYYYYCC